jgi:hypothetical protein
VHRQNNIQIVEKIGYIYKVDMPFTGGGGRPPFRRSFSIR